MALRVGDRPQPTTTVLAHFSGFRSNSICDRLGPGSTTGIHKGPSVVLMLRTANDRDVCVQRPLHHEVVST
jgi:hypothetical protein